MTDSRGLLFQGLEEVGLLPNVRRIPPDGAIAAHAAVKKHAERLEALFRSAKHNYLFQQRLETLETFAGHASFYLTQHNEVMPHNAFNGATPLEMYTGSWGQKCETQITEQAKASKAARHAHNTAGCCPICPF